MVRKTVTALFSDVVMSTELGERLDPESLRQVMTRWFDEMRLVIERHGGTVEKFIGDEIMAVFGVPTVHEDDALRAVRAAAEMRDRLGELNEELDAAWGVRVEARTGINTGEVVAGDPSTGQTFVTGEAVVLAKRLEQAAMPGEILIGKATYPLVRDAVQAGPLESFPVKGKAHPVPRRRLEGVARDAPGVARRLDAPLVGRRNELAVLAAAFEAALDEGACRLCTVLGQAGIGKSRLAAELRETLGDRATWLNGRCLPYGEGITFYPLAQIVNEAGGDESIASALEGSEDAELVAELLRGTIGRSSAPRRSEEAFWAVRRFLEGVAASRPLVLCLEDIHWAEATFLDLIEYLAGWIRDAPILLLCLARPVLLEKQPLWTSPRPNAVVLSLEPLSRVEADELLSVLGMDVSLSDSTCERIAAASEGNPLFVEQMVAMVAEEGEHDDELAIPPSIQALLAERLDRLTPEERAVVECASVIGKEFLRGEVVHLCLPDLRESAGSHLMGLVRKELIRPDTAAARRDDGFAFRHVLIRDAAYDAMPKEARADLHERFAAWGETQPWAAELEEIVGYHLEQAFRYREQLAPVDATASDLARRASALLSSAGRRAADRADMRAAASLFGRASALVPRDDPAWLPLAPHYATALMSTGDLARADQVLAEAIDSATATGERGIEARARVVRAHLRFATRPTDAVAAAESVAELTIRTFAELGDEVGLAQAWRLRAYADFTLGRWAASADRLERALIHAQRGGDERERANVLSWLPLAYYYGPMPAEEAIGRGEEIRARAQGDRLLEASVEAVLAPLLAMRGRVREARELSGRSRTLLEDLGALAPLASARAHGAQVEVLAGNPGAAERELRWVYETFSRIGDKVNAVAAAALLAEALEDQGRYEEAARWTELENETVPADEVLARVALGAVRAKALARVTRVREAERLARETVAVARTTDALNMRAGASLALSEVLSQVGKQTEAEAAASEALGHYREKGNLAAAAKAEQFLAQLRPVKASASLVDPTSLGRPDA